MGAPTNLWLEECIESEIVVMLEDDSYYESIATVLKPAAVCKQEHRHRLRCFLEMKELRAQFVHAQKIALELLPNCILPEEFVKAKNEFEQSAAHFIKFITSAQDGSTDRPVILQEILGFSDATLLHMYDLASSLVAKAEHKNAMDLFRFLTILAPHVTGYWIGLTLCLQAVDRHEEALAVLHAAKCVNPLNPVLFAYTIESYKALKDNDKIKLEYLEMEKVVSDLEVHQREKWKQKMQAYRTLFFT